MRVRVPPAAPFLPLPRTLNIDENLATGVALGNPMAATNSDSGDTRPHSLGRRGPHHRHIQRQIKTKAPRPTRAWLVRDSPGGSTWDDTEAPPAASSSRAPLASPRP